ncbi:MAG TPA: hypothetical protein VJK71_09845, partial [Gemmatimonadales bacterium]|nr:hypothetical protein [Gemmatimonadales bacterium]
IAGLLGCSGAPPADSMGVRDTAGVEIVEHPAGFEESLPKWVVDSTPLVDIGGREEPGHDLHRVGGAARLQDGRIVVINRGSGELRFFDSTGRYLSSAGRLGHGPGEFSDFIASVQVLPGDTLFVLDAQLRRGSFLAPSGEFVRSIPTAQRGERHWVTVSAVLRGGRLLAESREFSEMRETSGPVRRDPFAFVLMTPRDSALDTIAVVPGYEVHPGVVSEGGHEYPALRSLEFGRSTVWATDGIRIVVGTNEPDGIRIYDGGGKLLRIIRSATPPERVTEEHRKRRDQENLARIDQQTGSEQLKEEWRKNALNPRYAETFPYYERLLPGTDGALWLERVRRYNDEGRRYVVHDSAGRAIATVTCPERMRPYEVGSDLIIGLWRDPDDVQHVRVYKVGRSAGW